MFFITQIETKVACSIKRFTSTKSKDFFEALSIYHKNTSALIRTSTNQLTFWADRKRNSKERSMYTMGLYLNDIVIGFCQFAYFNEKKVIFIDYLAIDKKYRSFGTFFQFIDLIEDYVNQKSLEYKYIITEVGYLNNTQEPNRESRNLIRLLQMVGFGSLECTYYQPQLDEDNYESIMEAKLLILSNNEYKIASIKRETFLWLQELIYYDHYFTWYVPFKTDEQLKSYKIQLDKLSKKSKSHLHSTIKINYTNDNTYIGKREPHSNSPKKNFIMYIVSFVLIILTFIIVRKTTDLSEINMFLLFSFSLFIVFCFISLIDKNAKKILGMITDLIKQLFDKSW